MYCDGSVEISPWLERCWWPMYNGLHHLMPHAFEVLTCLEIAFVLFLFATMCWYRICEFGSKFSRAFCLIPFCYTVACQNQGFDMRGVRCILNALWHAAMDEVFDFNVYALSKHCVDKLFFMFTWQLSKNVGDYAGVAMLSFTNTGQCLTFERHFGLPVHDDKALQI